MLTSRRWYWGLCLGLLLSAGEAQGSPVQLLFELAPGQGVEKAISAQSSSRHRHSFELSPGRWLLELEQLAGDAVLELWQGQGQRIARVDSLFDAQGPERLAFEIETRFVGSALVYLRPGFSAGRYRLVLRPGSEDDGRWQAELRSTVAGQLAAGVVSGGDRRLIEETVGAFKEALAAWRVLGDARRIAEHSHSLGTLHRKLDQNRQALVWMDEALRAWRLAEDDGFIATALNHTALLRRSQGDAEAAEELLSQAVALYRRAGQDYGAAVASFNLCRLQHRRGDVMQARQCYLRALPDLTADGSARHLGNLLNSLGGTYHQLGEAEQARHYYDLAMEQHLLSGDLEEQAAVLNNRAALSRYLGFWGEAVADYQRAIELQRQIGDLAGEGRTLNNLGYGLLALGETQQAAQALEQALERRRQAEDLAGQAVTLNNLGSLYHAQGNPAKALAFRRRALELRQQLGLVRHQALTQLWMARDLRALGRTQEALATLDQALLRLPEAKDRRFEAHAWSDRGRLLLDLGHSASGIESLHRGLALQLELGDRWGEVESRVSLAEAELASGDRRAAMDQAEAAIAAIEALRRGVPNVELRATFLAAKGRAYELAVDIAMARYRQDGDAEQQRRALALSEMWRARSLIDLLDEAAVRRTRPREAATPARDLAVLDHSLNAGQIQRLLDPGSVLLEIALGERQSTLWTVTRESLQSYALPSRRLLEDLAVASHKRLSTQHLGAAPKQGEVGDDPLGELSRHLLAPLADALRGELLGRRLLVVADGALHFVPFAALRYPHAAGEPLVEHHEVLHLPSASTLAVLRRPAGLPSAAPVDMLLLADPVFNPLDPRFDPAIGRWAAGLPRQPQDLDLERLPGSGREAQIIAALLPAERVTVASGFDARRQRLLAAEAGGARLLHIATHGLIDASRPSASGLMLSRWSAAGQPVDGFLSLEDIYAMQLDADLVVLSGCRTAFGKEVRGEGLVGLSRGFLQAGSRAVVASLWQVEDAATAELMRHFYTALLRDQLSPSAALRLAQRRLATDPEFHDPFFWAGFVVQGDGRWGVTVRSAEN